MTVMAESSLAQALPEAASIFRQTRTVTQVNGRYDSSNRLLDDLAGGVRADVLITADAASMDRARAQGLVSGDVWTIATDRLVLAVPRGNPQRMAGLRSTVGRTLAACEDAAPCGSAARTLAGTSGVRLAPSLTERTATDVRDRVAEGRVEAGITYHSVVRGARDRLDVVEIDGALASNRLQAAVLTSASSPGPAEDFVKFMVAPQGQGVLRLRGFDAP